MAKRNQSKPNSEQVTKRLLEMLETAKNGNFDRIELEWQHEGLEVTFFTGSKGVGGIPFEAGEDSAVLELIDAHTKFKPSGQGRCDLSGLGWGTPIDVEEYNSFGESCLRLRLKPKAK